MLTNFSKLIYNWCILIVDEILYWFKMVIDVDNIVYPNNILVYTCLFSPFILFIDVYKVVNGYV